MATRRVTTATRLVTMVTRRVTTVMTRPIPATVTDLHVGTQGMPEELPANEAS